MLDFFFAALLIVLGIYQIYASWRELKFLRTKAGKDTSPFMLIALWSGFLIGVALIVFGISYFFQ
ncbi:hypothetical protein PQ472_00260 [Lacticaseibacillus pabuli]|uniref:Immunity protein 17 of polymorphic toxin system n=1 Tax=Lacticaseibacillus pabuli TaxID=3025672 RepID=A0ABY7WXP3_9LACO|nr:hypothetical protein [Lacticaseibacillus sp. KACC 23028]WDF82705.1 hypothetical protein PQ472_00260 [Lacticaseibacillus sp. KACC 23028]